MRCAWDKFLTILPLRFRREVDTLGRDALQQLHLRLGREIVLDTSSGRMTINAVATEEDLKFVVNTASRYSPWSAATAAQGYVTAPGGHRIGLCGHCIVHDGAVTGIREVNALCIRVARDFVGIAPQPTIASGNILIIGPPGSGKTTMLRDLIRNISNRCEGSIAVVDERGEIFPTQCSFDTGPNTDVLTFCPKPQGIMMALRTLGARWIALDEITDKADGQALQQGFNCGVNFVATAHALNIRDLRSRPLYREILDRGIFETVLVMQPDKSCCMERMALCN